MGKPIERDFTQSKGILKFFPYEGAACIVPQTMVADAARLLKREHHSLAMTRIA